MLADILLALPIPRPPTYLTSWKPGVTPLSTVPSVATTIALYLATIFGIHAFQQTRQPKKLNTLFQIHNVILSAGSGLLLVLILEEILPILWKHGVFYSVCGEGAWTEVSLCNYSHPPDVSECARANFGAETRGLLPLQLLLQVLGTH
jgi:fatty acid elongase 3